MQFYVERVQSSRQAIRGKEIGGAVDSKLKSWPCERERYMETRHDPLLLQTVSIRESEEEPLGW